VHGLRPRAIPSHRTGGDRRGHPGRRDPAGPFRTLPAGLGFTARYRVGELDVDGVELSDARWFHRDDMPMLFPGNVSISHCLIREFLSR